MYSNFCYRWAIRAAQRAAEVGCPVVPIAVHGTGDCLPKHGAVLRQKMYARVEVLDPIEAGDLGKVGLRNAARAAIAVALERGKGEARETEVVAA